MAWQDRLENIQFTIVTGDGSRFTPLWKNGTKSKQYNTSKYDFIGVEGSFIDRRLPQSPKYPLVFWFQGDDNIEQADAFEAAADDPRAWTITHPFYGTIVGQPTNINRNDIDYNATEITVDFWESITDDFPLQEVSPVDVITQMRANVNTIAIQSYVDNAMPQLSDIQPIKDNTSMIGANFVPSEEFFNDYERSIDTALTSLDDLTTATSEAITNVQEVVAVPALFRTPIIQRLNGYIFAYNEIKAQVNDVASKFYFETQGAAILSGMALAVVNPIDNDYITRSDIETVNTMLLDIYEDYLTTADNAQVSIYDIQNAWVPNSQLQGELNRLVIQASRDLFILSFNARQERTIEVEADTNLIVLTHRYLGLDANDANLERFRQINDIKNDELLQIKKGRVIRYFI